MPDVVVVGAGHNGLVAACYLARSGADVMVVERDTTLGGAVSTVERFPGYAVDRGSSAHIMIRHTSIIEELRLDRYGLVYDDLDPWGFAPFRGGALTFSRDLDRTCTEIESFAGTADADSYRDFVTDWGARNERIFAAFSDRPTAARLGRAIWGAGRGTGAGGMELARQFLASGDDLLDSHFSDERLKTALAWMGAQSGPPTHEPATADLVGWLAMLHKIPPGHPRGGSGKLTEALAARLAADGGAIRTGDPVTAIEVAGGSVAGVRTASGDRIAARVVVSATHVLCTFDLLGEALPHPLRARRARIDLGPGIGMVVRLATRELPRYRALGAAAGVPATPAYRALQLLGGEDRTTMRAAYGDLLAGRLPQRPAALVMTFSAFDPGLAPAGRHQVSIWGQWYPYRLGGGKRWSEVGRRAADTLIGVLEDAAPGFTAGITDRHIQTPEDIESELAMPHGNVMGVDMSLRSMFAMRPLPELAGYRMPGVDGLFLAGASMHPGGGVFGASGRIVAGLVTSGQRPGLLRRLRTR